ncbi:hypothetical protein [Dyadobacter sp. BHUBP1]|uniref:hypothetical protein n=1 Tax=Dyadobacter sp. BHUBP1 TaxID=3424178 RepID=UPI003D341D65
MNEQYDRKQQLQDGRDKLAQLEQRTLEEIAPQVGIKGIVSDMTTMGTQDWERARTCLYWLLNNTDYPYIKTVVDWIRP